MLRRIVLTYYLSRWNRSYFSEESGGSSGWWKPIYGWVLSSTDIFERCLGDFTSGLSSGECNENRSVFVELSRLDTLGNLSRPASSIDHLPSIARGLAN